MRVKNGVETPCAAENAPVDLEKRLANLWSRQTITNYCQKCPRRSWATNQLGNPDWIALTETTDQNERMNGERKIRVLWLEDEMALIQLAKEVLRTDGWMDRLQIDWVMDGDAAWKLLNQSPPEIFITDINHRGINGEELLKMIAAQMANYPNIVLSGFPGETARKEFFEFCATECPGLKVIATLNPFEIPHLLGGLASCFKKMVAT